MSENSKWEYGQLTFQEIRDFKNLGHGFGYYNTKLLPENKIRKHVIVSSNLEWKNSVFFMRFVKKYF